jgi:DDE superfamily endonuclease/Villin headpiece domain
MAPSYSLATRRQCRGQAITFLLPAAAVVLTVAAVFSAVAIKKPPRRRMAALRRARPSFESIAGYLSDHDFTRCFRMPREAFYNLLAILRGDLERQLAAATKSSGGRVEPASRLAILLRILGGASYLDMQLVFGVGRSTVFQVFHSTLRAINAKLQMPGVPVGNEEKMRANAEAFRTSRDPHSPLWGCIGALDGIALAIKKPHDHYFPRHFYTRKGFYAMPIQAVCDSKYKFLYMSARCVGSTHDSLAWAVSTLGRRLQDGLGLGVYWLAGDAAYVCADHLLTPYSKSQMQDSELGQRRDAFNFFHSSLRMHVEQAFGILVARFGILWRPMGFSLPTVPRILSACMRIHNYLIDQNVLPISSTMEPPNQSEAEVAFAAWWGNAVVDRDVPSQQGRRTDLGACSKRDELANSLHEGGLQRPCY